MFYGIITLLSIIAKAVSAFISVCACVTTGSLRISFNSSILGIVSFRIAAAGVALKASIPYFAGNIPVVSHRYPAVVVVRPNP